MAASSTREGVAAMVEESNEQSLPVRSTGWLANVRQFWHDIQSEMKKVSWPTQSEVVNTTIIVVVTVFFFALFLFLVDVGLTYLIEGIEWAAKKVFI
jgi:preprotein translocase subunit SecE